MPQEHFFYPPLTGIKPAKMRIDITRPTSALYIGNSLFFYNNNGVLRHVRSFVTAAKNGSVLRSTSVTINGSGLSWHDVESYFRPNGLGAYSFKEDNSIVFNPPTDKLFDVSVMVDCTQGPVHKLLRPLFFEYVKKHCASIRQHNSEPVLFMSWAYADEPDMTAPLAEAYTQAGNDNNALVVPVGVAFARSMKEHPDIHLYAPDKRHPSPEGSYLAGCVTYACLFNTTPEGLNYNGGIADDRAAILQRLAWDMVQEYFDK